MPIVERIKTLAKEQGTSIKQIERECGLGNATIRRWDANSPSLENVKKVANYLQVSIDFLALGVCQSVSAAPVGTINFEMLRSEQGLACDGHPLNEDEADLIAMYRLLDTDISKEIFDFAYFKYKRTVEDKKGSIYSTYCDMSKRQKSDPEDGENVPHGIA